VETFIGAVIWLEYRSSAANRNVEARRISRSDSCIVSHYVEISWMRVSYLDETDVGALLAEALTADVEAVLADETSGVGADAAVDMSLAGVLTYALLGSSNSIASRDRALPVLLSQISVGRGNVPLAGALAVGPRTRIPDRLVRHVGWCVWGVAMSLLLPVSVWDSD
jgi:hypothetical protein